MSTPKRRITPVMMTSNKKEEQEAERLRQIVQSSGSDATAAEILRRLTKDREVDESEQDSGEEVTKEAATLAAREIRAAIERMVVDVTAVLTEIDTKGVDVDTDTIAAFADKTLSNAAVVRLRYKNRLPRSARVSGTKLAELYAEAESRWRSGRAHYMEALEIVGKRARIEAEKARAKRRAFTPEQRAQRKAAREAWYADLAAREAAALAAEPDEGAKIALRRQYAAQVAKLPRNLAEVYDDDDSDSVSVSDDEYSLNTDDEDGTQSPDIEYDVFIDDKNGDLYLTDGSVDKEDIFFKIVLRPGEFVIRQPEDGTFWRGMKDSDADHIQLTAESLKSTKTRDRDGSLALRLKEWNDYQVYDDGLDDESSASAAAAATAMQTDKRIDARIGSYGEPAMAEFRRVVREQTELEFNRIIDTEALELVDGFSMNADRASLTPTQQATYDYLANYRQERDRASSTAMATAIDNLLLALARDGNSEEEINDFAADLGTFIRNASSAEASRRFASGVGSQMIGGRIMPKALQAPLRAYKDVIKRHENLDTRDQTAVRRWLADFVQAERELYEALLKNDHSPKGARHHMEHVIYLATYSLNRKGGSYEALARERRLAFSHVGAPVPTMQPDADVHLAEAVANFLERRAIVSGENFARLPPAARDKVQLLLQDARNAIKGELLKRDYSEQEISEFIERIQLPASAEAAAAQAYVSLPDIPDVQPGPDALTKDLGEFLEVVVRIKALSAAGSNIDHITPLIYRRHQAMDRIKENLRQRGYTERQIGQFVARILNHFMRGGTSPEIRAIQSYTQRSDQIGAPISNSTLNKATHAALRRYLLGLKEQAVTGWSYDLGPADINLRREFKLAGHTQIEIAMYLRFARHTDLATLPEPREPITEASLSDAARNAQLEYLAAMDSQVKRGESLAMSVTARLFENKLREELKLAGYTYAEIETYMKSIQPADLGKLASPGKPITEASLSTGARSALRRYLDAKDENAGKTASLDMIFALNQLSKELQLSGHDDGAIDDYLRISISPDRRISDAARSGTARNALFDYLAAKKESPAGSARVDAAKDKLRRELQFVGYSDAEISGYLKSMSRGESDEPITYASLSDAARNAQIRYLAAKDEKVNTGASPGLATAEYKLRRELRLSGYTEEEIDNFVTDAAEDSSAVRERFQSVGVPVSSASFSDAARSAQLEFLAAKNVDAAGDWRDQVFRGPTRSELAINKLRSELRRAGHTDAEIEAHLATLNEPKPEMDPRLRELLFKKEIRTRIDTYLNEQAKDKPFSQELSQARDDLRIHLVQYFTNLDPRGFVPFNYDNQNKADQVIAKLNNDPEYARMAFIGAKQQQQQQRPPLSQLGRKLIGGQVGAETIYAARNIIGKMQDLIVKMNGSSMEALLGTDARDVGIMAEVLKQLTPAGNYARGFGTEPLRLSFGILTPLPRGIRIITQLNAAQQGGVLLHYQADEATGSQASFGVLPAPPNQSQWLESDFISPPSIMLLKSFAFARLRASTTDEEAKHTLLAVYRPAGSANPRDVKFMALLAKATEPLVDVDLDPSYVYAVNARGMLVGARLVNSPAGNTIEWVWRIYDEGRLRNDAAYGSFAPPAGTGFPSGNVPSKLSVKVASSGQISITVLTSYEPTGAESPLTDAAKSVPLCVAALLVDVALSVQTQPAFATRLYYATQEAVRRLLLLSALSADRLLTVVVVDQTPETGGSTVLRMNANDAKLNLVMEAPGVIISAVGSGTYGLTVVAVPRPSAKDTVLFELVPVNTPQKYSVNTTQSTTRQTAAN